MGLELLVHFLLDQIRGLFMSPGGLDGCQEPSDSCQIRRCHFPSSRSPSFIRAGLIRFWHLESQISHHFIRTISCFLSMANWRRYQVNKECETDSLPDLDLDLDSACIFPVCVQLESCHATPRNAASAQKAHCTVPHASGLQGPTGWCCDLMTLAKPLWKISWSKESFPK